MLTLKKLSLGLVGAVFLSMISSPAKAINITTGGITVPGQGQVSKVPGSITVNFNDGVAPTSGPAVYSSPIGSPTIVTGSLPGQYTQPVGDTSPYLTISPIGSNVVGSTGAVTIDFTQAIDYFGLYWGSIDAYNLIAFYNGSNLIAGFTGSDITGISNSFVNFFAESGETFNRIILSSSFIAFESDNHAFRQVQVPEPASILALLACAALGTNSLVKRKLKAA